MQVAFASCGDADGIEERHTEKLAALYRPRSLNVNEAELQLQRLFVDSCRLKLPSFPYLYDIEWYAGQYGHLNDGRGDLVFTDGCGGFLVVETKVLSDESGKTACTSRKKARKAVKLQAQNYRCKLYEKVKVEGDVVRFIVASTFVRSPAQRDEEYSHSFLFEFVPPSARHFIAEHGVRFSEWQQKLKRIETKQRQDREEERQEEEEQFEKEQQEDQRKKKRQREEEEQKCFCVCFILFVCSLFLSWLFGGRPGSAA